MSVHQRSHFYTDIPLLPEVHFWLSLCQKSLDISTLIGHSGRRVTLQPILTASEQVSVKLLAL
ncbi:hypothetical protein QUA81_10610 [Microcoleus sp. F6_B4]